MEIQAVAKSLAERFPDLSPVATIEKSREDGTLKELGVSDILQVWQIVMALKDIKGDK